MNHKFLAAIKTEADVQNTTALRVYDANPGLVIAIRANPSEVLLEWCGGPLADIHEAVWRDLYPMLDFLPWPLVVAGIIKRADGLHYIVGRTDMDWKWPK